MKVLVTGAGGFVGTPLCAALLDRGHHPVAASRTEPDPPLPAGVEAAVVGSIDAATSWARALEGVEGVIHLAARTHVLRERSTDPETAYRETNVEGTRALLAAASASGVRRFVFMSSIKVNGESTPPGRAFEPDDVPAPEDAYGRTKRDAEVEVLACAGRGEMETVVVRAPLVYGPGVKGNFLRLMGLVQRRRPLPLALVRNRRSLVYVDNLCSALIACLERPSAPGQVFIVSDGEAVSTPALVRGIAAALGRRAWLVPVPVAALRCAGMVTGHSGAVRRLTGSLEVDDTELRARLGWAPEVDLAEGLRRTARWYLER